MLPHYHRTYSASLQTYFIFFEPHFMPMGKTVCVCECGKGYMFIYICMRVCIARTNNLFNSISFPAYMNQQKSFMCTKKSFHFELCAAASNQTRLPTYTLIVQLIKQHTHTQAYRTNMYIGPHKAIKDHLPYYYNILHISASPSFLCAVEIISVFCI